MTTHRHTAGHNPHARLGKAEAAVEAEERRQRRWRLGLRDNAPAEELERAELRSLAHAVFVYERDHAAVTPLYDEGGMSDLEAAAMTEEEIARHAKGYLVRAGMVPYEFRPEEWT